MEADIRWLDDPQVFRVGQLPAHSDHPIYQDTTFRCGESGILTFTVWGYADLVEVIFPEEMTRQNPELNRVYDYRDQPGYRITESIQFMVPLYTPENEQLPITVRAYKGDKKLEDHPQISVIGVKGSVLEDLRTRLR